MASFDHSELKKLSICIYPFIYVVNDVPADGLAPCVARASVSTVLTQFACNIPGPMEEELIFENLFDAYTFGVIYLVDSFFHSNSYSKSNLWILIRMKWSKSITFLNWVPIGYYKHQRVVFSCKSCLVVYNSLKPSDKIWRHRCGSTLAPVMACCLTAPSHYLSQCWLIISKVHCHSSEGNLAKDTSATNN